MDGRRWITGGGSGGGGGGGGGLQEVETMQDFSLRYYILFLSVHSCNVLATRPKVNLVCVCLCQGFQSWPTVLTDREHHEGKKQRPRGIAGNIIRTLNTLAKMHLVWDEKIIAFNISRE